MQSGKIYNEELKLRFLDAENPTAQMRALFLNVFGLVAPHEEEYSADICTWSSERLSPVLESLMGFRGYSGGNRVNLLKRYIRWCLTVVPDASSAIFETNVSGMGKLREMMLSGPEHLQKCLDGFLTPEDEKTVDVVLRGYCWLAFAGLSDREIVCLRARDVNLDTMTVSAIDREVSMPSESFKTMRILREVSLFKYSHSLYGNEFIWRERADGDKLLRGLRNPEPKLQHLRTMLSNRGVTAFKEGKIDVRPSFYRIFLSGEFYRALLMERDGIEPDFRTIADRAVEIKENSGKPYKLKSESGSRTVESKKREIARNYFDDYIRWKRLYWS